MWAASCLASCCAACACDACRTVVSSISRRSARIAYCGLFALSLIVSWILREVAAPLMEKLPWINHFHKTPDREWFETDAVLRVSLGNFVFFSILSVMMIGVKTQKDPRDGIHHGGWMMKVICWFILVILMFFVPNEVISFYESMSKFGAGFFLLVQVVLLLDFVHGWNDTWVGYDEQFWYAALLVVSLVCYLATFLFSGLLFHWFTPSGHDCGLNTFFIVMTLIFVFVFAVVVLHPAVGGSILPASVISFYCMYLCYSGLASEPRDYECNGLHKHSKAVSTGTMTIGLLTTVLSVVYSAVRAGKPLLPLDGKAEEKEEKEQKKPVTYSYAFFHIIFSLASMYSAMLLTGWSTSVGESGKLVDVGWPSVWVRVVTSWATAGLFIWSLIAPILFPDREKVPNFGFLNQVREGDRKVHLTISRAQIMDSTEQSIIPGLPDDLALICIAKLSHGHHGALECVSRGWRDLLRSADYSCFKARNGWSGTWLFVLTEQSKNQWVAYDPEADRWHPLPRTRAVQDGWHHSGFACVCVSNCLLVIGGCYAPSLSSFPHQKPVVTGDVMRFDPFKKEWKMVASMRTPRTHFACSAVSGKVYVAGGRNLTHSRGITSAEVYDPVADRWEELPAMPRPQMDCLGLSYRGSFHVLSDQVGFAEQSFSEVFNPLEMSWSTVEDIWPFSRAMQFAVQVMKSDRVYTIVDWGESLIKTRDTDEGEWYNVGSVPSVVLANHPRELEAFGYGFAALRDELFVIGGKVLKWEESGAGRFAIVRLSVVRVCNPLDRPLNWRETKPMCVPAGGSIIGCASLEESSLP
ncbi:hypothetical protein Bca4012_094155 [Brassica carinata]